MLVSALLSRAFRHPRRQPFGPSWVHEIKEDGFRRMVRRDPAGIPLITRNGHDWSWRFPLIEQAAAALRARSFLVDGEAVGRIGNGDSQQPCARWRPPTFSNDYSPKTP